MFAYCFNQPVRYKDSSGYFAIEITVTTVGIVIVVGICAIALLYYGTQALFEFFSWLADQWYSCFSQINFVYEAGADKALDQASEASVAVMSPDPFDDDDDYYENDDNFGSTKKVGTRKGNSPQNNQRQNEIFDRAAKKLGLNKNQRQRLHRSINGQGLSFEEILQYGEALFMVSLD